MLFRAGIIYGLAVAIVLLGTTLVWQRAAISSLSADATSTANMALDLRAQLDAARTDTANAQRDVRLIQQALDVEARKRGLAETSAAAARSELDRLKSAGQEASAIRKSADGEIAVLKKDFEAQQQANVQLQATLDAARAEAELAKTALDTLRRQMPVAITGAIPDPPAPHSGTAPAASVTQAPAATASETPAAQSSDSAGTKRPQRAFTSRRANRRRLPAPADIEPSNGLPF